MGPNTKVVNGILLAILLIALPITVRAANVPINGLWQQFKFFEVGVPAIGCSSTSGCVGSPGGNSEYAGTHPWTFTAPQSGAVLTVVDSASSGDVFEVFDFGSSIGTTSQASSDEYCGFDPEVCLEDPDMSSGVFVLGPGNHEITIVPTVSPFNIGAAYFRVTAKLQLFLVPIFSEQLPHAAE